MKTPEEQAELDSKRTEEIQRQNATGVPQPGGKPSNPATANVQLGEGETIDTGKGKGDTTAPRATPPTPASHPTHQTKR